MPTTSSGLQYEDITPGTGAEALSGRTVQVHYSGWLHEQGHYEIGRASCRERV